MKKLNIPNYQILGELAKGGMSTIYLAQQTSLGRTVVLKFLRNELLDSERLRQRFKREALAISSLAHENIVSVYDLLDLKGGLCLVMEYVEGVTLQQLLATVGPLPAVLASTIILQLVRALEYAHGQGFVHRDIKPANILINDKGLVKLADFGIVKSSSFADVTLPGTFLGTPRYMSPQQSLAQAIDFTSDLFSLGVCWYEAISGLSLFRAKTPEAVIAKVRRAKVVPLSKLMFTVPQNISALISRCLAAKTKRRFAATEELRKKLEKTLADKVGIDLQQPIAEIVKNLSSAQLKSLPQANPFRLKLLWRLVQHFLLIIILALFSSGLFYPRHNFPFNHTAGYFLQTLEDSKGQVILDGYPLSKNNFKQSVRAGAHQITTIWPSRGKVKKEVVILILQKNSPKRQNIDSNKNSF